MLKDSEAFSGFSIRDAEATRDYYGEKLGLDIGDAPGMEGTGMLELHIKDGPSVFLYSKADHEPATYTVLNFPVADIDAAVDELEAAGVPMIRYDNPDMPQDDKGIARGLEAGYGPDVAWFTDPSGNVLSILQTDK